MPEQIFVVIPRLALRSQGKGTTNRAALFLTFKSPRSGLGDDLILGGQVFTTNKAFLNISMVLWGYSRMKVHVITYYLDSVCDGPT